MPDKKLAAAAQTQALIACESPPALSSRHSTQGCTGHHCIGAAAGSQYHLSFEQEAQVQLPDSQVAKAAAAKCQQPTLGPPRKTAASSIRLRTTSWNRSCVQSRLVRLLWRPHQQHQGKSLQQSATVQPSTSLSNGQVPTHSASKSIRVFTDARHRTLAFLSILSRRLFCKHTSQKDCQQWDAAETVAYARFIRVVVSLGQTGDHGFRMISSNSPINRIGSRQATKCN